MTCCSCNNGSARTNPVNPAAAQVTTRTLQNPVEKEKIIVLPIAFHIPTQFIQLKDGKLLNMWLTCSDIAVIFHEVNTIWRAANIRFAFNGCILNDRNPTQTQLEALGILEKSDRKIEEEYEELNQERKAAIRDLSVGMPDQVPNSFNAFFVPFMGSTRQGNAVGGETTICCGVWSDKPSRGRLPPEKRPLTEAGAFVIGSIGRTVAHELGHCLGLGHNDPPAAKPNIMGNPEGYAFTPAQIRVARETAIERSISLKNGRSSKQGS